MQLERKLSMYRWNRRNFLQIGFSGLGLSLASCQQETGIYPSRPIRLIVPYASGGGTDTEARSIAPYVERLLGAALIVENQPGADGRMALSKFARAEGDGYSISIYGIPSIIIGEMLFRPSYQVRDFSHILAWISENQVLVASAGRWNTFEEFLQAAKKQQLSGGIAYLTSAGRLAGLVMERALGTKFNWVPFGSSGRAIAALLGQHVDFCITAAISSLSMVESAKAQALLVFGSERDKAYPNTPVPKEMGLEIRNLPIIRGVVAPPETDPARLAVLEKAFASAVANPEFRAQAERLRLPLVSLSSSEYLETVEGYYTEIQEYRSLFQDRG